MKKSITERFWSKVDVRGEDDCWEWQACKDDCGYGKLATEDRKWDRSHRISYRIHFGEIDDGQCVCHSCDNPSCCNPKHFWLGTHSDNMEDMTLKKRAWGTRLNEEDVVKIRVLHEQGGSMSSVGEKFGISPSHVHRIVNRICWKHVP